MSKGSSPRPINIPQKEYSERWDLIFKKRNQTEVDEFTKAIFKDEFYDVLDTADCLTKSKD